ncbi:hypothetical protein WMY93_018171 [Mugilogobius chulae]|uniref:Sideroflexin-4 n=1 Tax=Mugilogobius chulae TaxID=88201 RepID=A0AAW0NU10_9GOBI
MDPNLLHWKNQGQSFLGRIKIWFDVLDPTLLISSDAEIEKAHRVLGGEEKTSDKEKTAASTLSLSSVHADTGTVLPIIFRPPAVLPISAPIVYAAFLPHRSVKTALVSQFLKEQNNVCKADAIKLGTVSYATCAGAVPQILINRLQITAASVQNFCRTVLPVPLAAILAFFSLATVRSTEAENGIQVFDSEGNAVGFSKAAERKAIRETGLSRTALIGTTAAAPNIIASLLQRTSFFRSRSLLLAPLRPFSLVFVLGLMIPCPSVYFHSWER